MFRVNHSENRLEKLEQKRFSDLNLSERQHLQEWLVGQPDALGEDLLIIQKEFDGFADTRERLDLLALDKDGQLVVIENKLDDSGRDVTWQALKYTAYVSSLTMTQIVDIYQKYLERYCGGGDDAQNAICEFLEIEDLGEVVLNEGSGQRLFLVAANFRKEVTATVLWLREYRIDARCFKVVPYAFGDELFVDIQPVIPTPEAADFMIGMAEKESEARGVHGEQKELHSLRRDYWEMTLEALKKEGDTLYQNINPSKDHWLSAGSGMRSCHYTFIFTKSEIRVEFSFHKKNAEENKWLFDRLKKQKEQIEKTFGHEIDWLRLDDKKSSRLQFGIQCDGLNRDKWPEYVDWHVNHIQKLRAALEGPIAELNTAFKSWENHG
ncbi:DUF4268 domain-containing protein [Ruegeria sp.]|uniref:DUF4268 domain-containing protein n=1 Tax=Ruegeria sp. TaxID=1879320 RepID=UPI003C7C25D2